MDETFFWGSPDFSRGHWLRGREKTHPHFLKSRLVDLKPREDSPSISLKARKKPQMELKLMSTLFSA
ncbi:hypothetical protein VNO77_08674 [Canavalia gladiata]|uniref:Uncharacterized protein n=1 Tax=Canavalia gladiata TaxID=3824 RepID=A0AAN9ME28_CANGL